jgi:hypothetical protein
MSERYEARPRYALKRLPGTNVIVWPIAPQVNIPTETDEDRIQRLKQIIGAELTLALQKLAALRGKERVLALVYDSLRSQGLVG